MPEKRYDFLWRGIAQAQGYWVRDFAVEGCDENLHVGLDRFWNWGSIFGIECNDEANDIVAVFADVSLVNVGALTPASAQIDPGSHFERNEVFWAHDGKASDNDTTRNQPTVVIVIQKDCRETEGIFIHIVKVFK